MRSLYMTRRIKKSDIHDIYIYIYIKKYERTAFVGWDVGLAVVGGGVGLAVVGRGVGLAVVG